MQRRSVLRACGAVGVAGLAGCGSRGEVTDDGEDAEPPAGTTTDGTPSETTPPTLVGTTIEAGETSCGEGTDEANVTFRSETTAVSVDGTIGAPNPCHAPTVDAVSYDAEADRLSLTVGVESGDAICMECIGDLPYTITATFEGGLPGRVVVDHAGVESPVADETSEEGAM